MPSSGTAARGVVRGKLGFRDAASLLQEANLPLSSFAVLARLILSRGRSILFQYCKEGICSIANTFHKLRKVIPVIPTQTQINIHNNFLMYTEYDDTLPDPLQMP